MPRSESGPRYRSTAIDRALAPARTVVVVGPMADIDPEFVRTMLRTAQDSSPTPRLALEPRSDTRLWRYRDDLADSVIVRDDLDTSDLAHLVTEIRTRTEPRAAMEVILCGDYIVIDYSHGIADGQMGVTLPAVLSAGDSVRAAQLSQGLSSHAAWPAVWRHYRANPAALKRFWQLRREHGVAPESVAQRRIKDWRNSVVSFSAYLGADDVTELRAWAKTKWPEATSASIHVSLWLAALHAEGVSVDDRVMVLMNSRRYLGREYAAVHGNFAVAIPIRLPGQPSPTEVTGVTRDVIESGWPVAVLAMAEIKSLIPGADAVAEEQPEGIAVGDRIRAVVSDVGRLRMYEPHPWRTDGRPPQLVAYLEPDGPDAVSLLVSELAGVVTFTASFCSEMVSAATVEAAVRRMCSDPIGLLEGQVAER